MWSRILHQRHWLVFAVAVIGLGTILTSSAEPQTGRGDEAGVRAAIQQYFKGHATRDGAEMRKAFLPTAHIEGLRNNQFVSWTVDEYCKNFDGKVPADESSRKRTIDSVDIVGTAAMAKATLVHGTTTFTDYFVLMKVNGEWKIANKVYHAQR